MRLGTVELALTDSHQGFICGYKRLHVRNTESTFSLAAGVLSALSRSVFMYLHIM